MTAFFCTILAIILLLIWPPVYNGIVTFVSGLLVWVHSVHYYMVFNRLLIPTGLHHALNNVFWFDTAGINDIGKFQSGKNAIKGITGRYQAGFFPVMMFGVPAAALAMYHTAKTNQKTSLCLVFSKFSFGILVGVTEPIEFLHSCL